MILLKKVLAENGGIVVPRWFLRFNAWAVGVILPVLIISVGFLFRLSMDVSIMKRDITDGIAQATRNGEALTAHLIDPEIHHSRLNQLQVMINTQARDIGRLEAKVEQLSNKQE